MAPIKTPLGGLLLLPLLFTFVFCGPDRCYFPNGDLDKAGSSCRDAEGKQSGLCCQPGDYCINNTLCARPTAGELLFYYRGSCLDQTWDLAACPHFCLDFTDQIALVYQCRGDPLNWYCGGGARDKNESCGGDIDSFALDNNMGIYGTAPIFSTTSSTEQAQPTRGVSTEAQVPTDTPESQSTTIAPEPAESSPGQPENTPTETSTEPPLETDSVSETVVEPAPTESPTAPLFVSYETTTSTPDTVAPAPVPAPGTTESASSAEPPSTSPAPSEAQSPSPSSDTPTATPSDTPQDTNKSSSALPIGVGIAVGTSVLIASSVLVFFYQRKRRRQAPVRAETPPPFEFAFINNQAPIWLGPSYGPKPAQVRPGGEDGAKDAPKAGGGAQAGP